MYCHLNILFVLSASKLVQTSNRWLWRNVIQDNICYRKRPMTKQKCRNGAQMWLTYLYNHWHPLFKEFMPSTNWYVFIPQVWEKKNLTWEVFQIIVHMVQKFFLRTETINVLFRWIKCIVFFFYFLRMKWKKIPI